MGKIVVLIGASGSGKSTLDNKLRNDNNKVHPVTSITTRTRRDSDKDGDFEYLSKEEFIKLKDGGKFLWSTQYGQNWYGTTEESVLGALNHPNLIGTMVLVPEIIGTFIKYLKSIKKLGDVHFYYIDVSDELRKDRLSIRDGNQDTFAKRLKQDKEQKEELFQSYGDLVNIIENNGNLEEFLKNAIAAIKKDLNELAK